MMDADAATRAQQLVTTLRQYEAAWLAYKLDDPMRAQLRTEARQLRKRAYADGGLALVQRIGEQAIAAGIFVLTIDDVWGLDWRPFRKMAALGPTSTPQQRSRV